MDKNLEEIFEKMESQEKRDFFREWDEVKEMIKELHEDMLSRFNQDDEGLV